MKRSILMVALILAGIMPGFAQQGPAQAKATAPRAEVLVLGTYHMANPGRDIYNMKADDVLAPKRQAEIAQVIEVLKRFRPTKIAVESDAGDELIPKRYADYLAGKYTLSRNEIDQLALRLAKELGHKTVYPADADGDFPYARLVDYAKAHGREKELDATMNGFQEDVKSQGEYLATHSVLDTLLYMNTDARAEHEVGIYYQLGRFGEPDDWAGADLLAEWYRRNARIYSNILQLINSPNERVLVIFGAGHLGWLRHDFASNPQVRLRELAEFAK